MMLFKWWCLYRHSQGGSAAESHCWNGLFCIPVALIHSADCHTRCIRSNLGFSNMLDMQLGGARDLERASFWLLDDLLHLWAAECCGFCEERPEKSAHVRSCWVQDNKFKHMLVLLEPKPCCLEPNSNSRWRRPFSSSQLTLSQYFYQH